MKRRLAYGLCMLLLIPIVPAWAQVALPDFTQIAEQSGTAVVNVSTTQTRTHTLKPRPRTRG